jgi:diguanylate cyclase (GGDEF)-like protein/PAS domain S-box-containing protein
MASSPDEIVNVVAEAADGFPVNDLPSSSSPRPESPVPGVPMAELLDALPDATLIVDPDGRLRWGNASASRLFGLTLDEAVGRSGLELVHPDDQQLAALSLDSVRSKDVGTPLELRVRGADGWILVEMIGAPVGGMILLSVRDLTERRRWEVAGDEVARFRSLVQNATAITMLLDRDGTVRASSGGLTRLLGVDQEQVEGRGIETLVADDTDREHLAAALRDVQEAAAAGGTPPPVTVDVGLGRMDGGVVPFALTITNLLDDPTVEGLVLSGHDISDRVRTEQELRTSNSVLAATLESTADGILVVDRHGHTTCNTRFIEMWRLPAGRIGTSSDGYVTPSVLEQLEDPESFLAATHQPLDGPDLHGHDQIAFKDGRVFEREWLPQRIDGDVVGRVWSFRDVTENRRLQDRLSHQAFHDPLTGLANQALFRDRLSHATAKLARTGGRLAVLFIDLDDFKTVNDSLGHPAGDLLLTTVSARLSECLRPGDTAARLGGDEFAVLIEELAHPDDATLVAKRIVDALQAPAMVEGRPVSAAASIGITYGSPPVTTDEVLRNADLAMYTAKADGKNCYRVFAEEMHHDALQRLDVETHLRGAGDRGELVVHYQPIRELRTGRITAMEALVRWQHPSRGLLGPQDFIPFAEQGGLIDDIGRHVLESACEEACAWIDVAGADAPAVSVNLSPRQLLDRHLPDRVELLLDRCGLEPGHLILEITEGALMKDPLAAVASLQQLGRIGVRLAVDDFGTGYSSLAYLRQFPLDLLKIDGAFVDDTLLKAGWSLAEVIVRISHTLGLVPIAEGIESQAAVDALVGMGCDLGQGYHLGRPLDADGARKVVAETGVGGHIDVVSGA